MGKFIFLVFENLQCFIYKNIRLIYIDENTTKQEFMEKYGSYFTNNRYVLFVKNDEYDNFPITGLYEISFPYDSSQVILSEGMRMYKNLDSFFSAELKHEEKKKEEIDQTKLMKTLIEQFLKMKKTINELENKMEDKINILRNELEDKMEDNIDILRGEIQDVDYKIDCLKDSI